MADFSASHRSVLSDNKSDTKLIRKTIQLVPEESLVHVKPLIDLIFVKMKLKSNTIRILLSRVKAMETNAKLLLDDPMRQRCPPPFQLPPRSPFGYISKALGVSNDELFLHLQSLAEKNSAVLRQGCPPPFQLPPHSPFGFISKALGVSDDELCLQLQSVAEEKSAVLGENCVNSVVELLDCFKDKCTMLKELETRLKELGGISETQEEESEAEKRVRAEIENLVLD